MILLSNNPINFYLVVAIVRVLKSSTVTFVKKSKTLNQSAAKYFHHMTEINKLLNIFYSELI
jgi:hypothetical protein